MNNLDDDKQLLLEALREIKHLRAEIESNERPIQEPIAIIGMACRFPGGADNPDAFWEILKNGIDTVSKVPSDRWNTDEIFNSDPHSPGHTVTKYGAFLDSVDQFDPEFFGIAPKEAAELDPQQRLLLEVVWEALENAGVIPEVPNCRAGAIIGIGTDDYSQFSINSGDYTRINPYNFLGNARSIAVGRLAYCLGLKGMSLQLDTSCSSSLLAVHLGCRSLNSRDLDIAIVGGVNIMLSPIPSIGFSRLNALAPDGRSKAFDDRANGYGRGEGCGIVVLKRLRDAQQSKDPILALIPGSAANHDGHSNGLTAPNGQAQERLIENALSNANIPAELIQYVEAHGTGTSLGDPIEVAALGRVLGPGRSFSDPLQIGTVKSNLGHLEAGAGIAALIKVILSLQHKQIPKSLHFNTPNKFIKWDQIPIRVASELLSWPNQKEGRMAGVSSFGMSGTNVHIILNEAPPVSTLSESHTTPFNLLTLSASAKEGLEDAANRNGDFLRKMPTGEIANHCFTAACRRIHFDHRLVVLGKDAHELSNHLEAFGKGKSLPAIFMGQNQRDKSRKIAFLFTGQGSQYVGMGKMLFDTQPIYRKAFIDCASLLDVYLEKPILSIVYSNNTSDPEIHNTNYTQPALFALEYALAKLWMSWGIKPDIVMGHSIGEYAAAVIAGVFSLKDAAKLIAIRGNLMHSLPTNGAMMVVLAPKEMVLRAIETIEDVTIAVINGPKNHVLSGKKSAFEKVTKFLNENDLRFKMLTVSHAFHSPLMNPIINKFSESARSIQFKEPSIPFVSTKTGNFVSTDEISSPYYWTSQITDCVQFYQGMKSLENKTNSFIEIGPSPTLLGMGMACIPSVGHLWLPSLAKGKEPWKSILSSLATLYVNGVAVDWKGFHQGQSCRHMNIPTYPFQRKRYWCKHESINDAHSFGERKAPDPKLHPLLGRRVLSALDAKQFEVNISDRYPSFLKDHRLYNAIIYPAVGYFVGAWAAGRKVWRSTTLILQKISLAKILPIPEDSLITMQTIISEQGPNQAQVAIYSSKSSVSDDREWQCHAKGIIKTKSSDQNELINLDSLKKRCVHHKASGMIYSTIREKGGQLGGEFQVLTELWHGELEVLAKVRIPGSIQGDEDAYGFHPVLLDGAMQLPGECIPKESPLARSGTTLVPTGIKKLTISPTTSRELWCHLKLQLDQDLSLPYLLFDFHLFTDLGKVLVEGKGLQVKSLAKKVVHSDLESQGTSILYEINWNAFTLPKEAQVLEPVSTQKWLLFGDQCGLGKAICQDLENQKLEFLLVTEGENGQLGSDHNFIINPKSQKKFISDVQAIINNDSDRIGPIIYLWNLDLSISNEGIKEGPFQEIIKHCYQLTVIVQTLLQAQHSSFLPKLWIVTRGAQKTDSSQMVNMLQSVLWGLARTIHTECNQIFGGIIDLEYSPKEQARFSEEINLIQKIVNLAGDENQIAIRNNQFYLPKIKRRKKP